MSGLAISSCALQIFERDRTQIRFLPSAQVRVHAFADRALAQLLRSASATPISVAPPNKRLIPTKSPTAQTVDPGIPTILTTADSRYLMPYTCHQLPCCGN